MKIKDIEKNLKKESEQVVVPDVYARVKKAPINRLLSDPVHAFQRKMVMRMLFIAVVILLVVALSLSAILLAPSKASVEEYGYLRVAVNGDGAYGFVVNKAGVVSASITEKVDGAAKTIINSACVGKAVEDAILTVYHINSNDEVVVSAFFDDFNTANSIAVKVVGSVELQGKNVSVETKICDIETKVVLVEYVNAHLISGSVNVNYSTLDLVRFYVSIASASL